MKLSVFYDGHDVLLSGKGSTMNKVICVALLAVTMTACANSASPQRLLASVGAYVVHEDESVTSGDGELWYSPILAGPELDRYAEMMKSEYSEALADTIVYDENGRVWHSCYEVDGSSWCTFRLFPVVCESGCSYDVMLRSNGALKAPDVTYVPWEDPKDEGDWIPSAFDFAKVAERGGFWARLAKSGSDNDLLQLEMRVLDGRLTPSFP